MRGFARLSLFPLALFCTAGLVPTVAQTSQNQSIPTTAEAAQWRQDISAWRGHREAEISAPEGWLTLAGMEWLKPGVNSIGAAADNQIRLKTPGPDHLGMLTVRGDVVQLLSPAGGFPADLTTDGKPAREGSLAVDGAHPTAIGWHGLSLVVLKRGDRFVLRIKDANSPARTGFHGLNWYAPNADLRVTARWVPFKPRVIEEIPTVIGTTLKLPAPGLAMFLIDGKVQHLEPVLEDPAGKMLFFILRDETSKTATYGGGRFLHTGLPDHGLDQPGALILDFNQLENPPCAYTTYATCPLPPEQNRLDVPLEAGERRY
jgi:uncharacterized protein (DUF1684 family)